MQLDWREQDQAFAELVDRFVSRHSGLSLLGWIRAVQAQGWTVPAWPQRFGGLAWSPTQQFIWRRACAGDLTAFDMTLKFRLGVDAVGLALVDMLENGSPDAQLSQVTNAWLDEIRTCRSVWHLVSSEVPLRLHKARAPARAAEVRPQEPETAESTAIIASGELCITDNSPIEDAFIHRLLVAAVDEATDQPCFVVLDPADHSGFEAWQCERTLDSRWSYRIELDAERLQNAYILPPAVGFTFDAHGGPVSGDIARGCARVLQILEPALAEFDEDDAVHRRFMETQIAIRGLEAMELRWLDASARDQPPPFDFAALQIKESDILLKLGELQVDCFGYYALPALHEHRFHNEGAIGPQQVSEAARAHALAQSRATEQNVAADREWSLRDRLNSVLQPQAPDDADSGSQR